MVVKLKTGDDKATKCSPFFVIFGIMLLPSLLNIQKSITSEVFRDLSDSTGHYEAFYSPTLKSSKATTTTKTTTSLSSSLLPNGQISNATAGTASAVVTSMTLSSSESSIKVLPPASSREEMIQEALHISRERLIERVPNWTMEFFDWQQEQLKHVTEENWRNHRFLVMRCSFRDPMCGGMTDRIRVLPMMLRVAHACKRIFMIRWELPHPLEAFLLPTSHFNWTVPSYMEKLLLTGDNHISKQKHSSKLWKFFKSRGKPRKWIEVLEKDEPTIVEIKSQIHDGGARLYKLENFNSTPQESYETMYHGIFRGVFQPVSAIEAIVRQRWDILKLTPSQYNVAHSRNFYKITMDKVSRRTIEKNSEHSVNCASQVEPGKPIFFASDSLYATQFVQNYADANNYKIYTGAMLNQSETEPLHLDFAARGNKTYPAKAFYDAFVDFLILANGKCVSYGIGGFGEYTSLVSFDASCGSSTRRQTCPKFLES